MVPSLRTPQLNRSIISAFPPCLSLLLLQEELDRREAQITALTTETSTLQTTLATVQTELVAQSTEVSELASELSQLRLQASSSSDSSLARERDFREELERVRSEREDWELACEKERERADEEERRARVLEAEQRRLRDEGMREREAAKRERERASNLQGVLEEFQGGESGSNRKKPVRR